MSELNIVEQSGAPQASGGEPTIVNGKLVMPFDGHRTLTLAYPGPLAQYHLVRAMGPEEAQNTRLCLMYMPLVYLTEIDGAPALLPSSLRQIEALITRLGHKGLAALQAGVKLFDEQETVETAKN